MKTHPANLESGAGARATTPVGHVDSAWTFRDYLGALAVRCAIGRMNYRVTPGLYALGSPDAAAPVFVTANYKLTFDRVRRAIKGLSAWLLVLDTDGVNVWCAAGKGTFSTAELCRQIEHTGLAQIVSHRRLVVPQLGAVGVAAHEVTKKSGFRVEFGPVRAEDIPAWLAAGREKDQAMRTVRFSMTDRLVLVPVEIRNALAYAPAVLAAAFVLALIRGRGLSVAFPTLLTAYGIEFLGAVVLSAFLVPCLLPHLPGRSFSLKGAVVGLGWASAGAWAGTAPSASGLWSAFRGDFTVAGAVLMVAAIAAFVALNFTGATVFTSQSGTTRETKIALPAIGALGAIGFVAQTVGATMGELQ